MMRLINRLLHPALLKRWSIVLFGMAIMPVAQADALKDPTQPPASIYSNAENGEHSEQAAAPVLQSVLIGPQRRTAIINGKAVMLGNKYEQATLIKLDAHKAVLRNPDMTTQILLMDYAIEKKTLSPAAIPSAAKVKTKRPSKPIVVSEK